MNMSPRCILLLVCLLSIGLTTSAQYTEKINSNRPGTSQGAFSVGNNVLQFEGGMTSGKRKHEILDTKTNSFALDYTARYGLLIEQLEIRLNGRFRTDAVKFTIGGNEEKLNQTNFELNTIGAKYLIYDPYKKPKEKDSVDVEDLKSWKRTHRFRWKSLIPAVSAYAGVNLDSEDNPFIGPGQEGISPKLVIATQNNWNTRLSGDWVLVTNLIFDRIATDDMILGWIITSSHTINDNWAVFGEFQGQKSDFYSDNLLRLGGAYLFNKDLQLDANIAFNFKDTPSVFNCSIGASYRLDWHSKDEIIEQPGLEKGIKDNEKDKEEGESEDGEENEDGIELDEIEEIENDSLKQGKTPFINDFEDDSFRDALEKDLDERRTEQRIERERIEAEKLAKKEGKKQEKEDRRRLKREEKEAREAEKARIKAEKEKEKMIEDIDAELDKIEQDDTTDDELLKLEEELKKLEQEEEKAKTDDQKDKDAVQKKAEEDKKIDEEYEKLKKEEEKAKKEEEKRRKKEEKKRQKEEEKRKKEEDQDQ